MDAQPRREPDPSPSAGPRARRVRATVLFADLVGFTRLSEALGAEAAYAHVTGCLRLLDGVLRRHGGAVDKYLGDALMAVFGHPVPHPDGAAAALDAALEMRRRVEAYVREAGLPSPLALCVGVNTGPMVAGDIRGPVIREFHVLGDAVNTAARLKSKAPRGGIYAGPETRADARGAFVFRDLAPMPLKGKAKPVPVFELVGRRGGALPRTLDLGELVGREAETARLDAALEGLRAGRGGVLWLLGAEGTGKSRLLAHAEARAREGGLALRRVALFPVGAGAPDPLAALETAARAAAPGDPEVLMVDDLHWLEPAGETGAARVAALATGARQGPRLLVLAARPEELAPGGPLARLAAEAAPGERLELGPLAPAAARRLVQSLAGPELDPAARALVLERAAGNPLRLTIGSFLSGALRSESERAAEERSSETERRRSTVLFADLSGFTAMSERMAPEEAYPVVADCLALLDGIARRHGGTVDKYLGDCVLALFGVPRAMEDAPRAAVNAAIEMIQAVRAFSRERGLEHPLEVHVGINTGLGIAGDVSGPLLREFALMGDPVVIASELTDRAARGEVYVGPETWRFTREAFDYGEPEDLALKDRGAVPVYALRSRRQRLHRVDRKVFSDLVGRERELETLTAALRHLGRGRGGIVALVGEAGVGKSRLVAELASRAGDAQVSWQQGRALSTGRQLAYHPFADLCRSWAGITDEDDGHTGRQRLRAALDAAVGSEAAEIFPLVAALMALPLEPAENERLERMQGEARERLLRAAVTRILRRGSELAPVVVMLDDLHWADQSSIELLESLLRLGEEHRILFLCVFRPGFPETSGRILEQARRAHASRLAEIELAPLDRAAARALIKRLFRGGDIPHATRRTIEEKAKGNPFYIEEVVRSLLDLGAVERVDGGEGGFRATAAIADVEIPGTVHEVVMARVDRLPLRRRGLLQVASVAGQGFHRDLLRAFAESEDAFDEDLGALLDAEFLVPWDRFAGEEYAFKHPLLQEVTYDGIAEARRVDLHRAVGDAIEARVSPDIPGYHGMLAYHFGLGRDAERAEQHLFRAGDEAARVAASSEALRFFRDASRLYLELHGDGGDPRKKALLEKNVGLALYHRGQLIEADEHFNAALRLLGQRVPDSELALVLRFARNLGSVLASLYLPVPTHRHRPADAVQREVMDLMLKRAEAQTTASPRRFLFDSMDALAFLDRVDARSIPGAGGLYAGTVGIFSYGGLSFGLSERFLRRAAGLVHPGDPDEMIFFRVMGFLHHLLAGDWSDEHGVEDPLLEEALAVGRLWPVTNYLNLDGLKRIFRGDHPGARARIAWLREIAERYEHDLAASAARALVGIQLLEQRALGEALQALELYYDEHPEAPFKVSALGNRAEAQLLGGDLDGAEESLERAERYRREAGRVLPYHLSSYLRARYRADVERLARDGPGRRALRRRAAAARRAALGVARKVAWRRPEVWRTAGRHAWLLGRPDAARRAWAAGLAEAGRLGARADAARIHLCVAAHVAASSRGAEAPGLDGWSAAAHRERGHALLREVGVPPDPEGPG